MKRCPTCQRDFEDAITYCLEDGTPLVSGAGMDSEPTLVSSSAGGREIPPTAYEQLGGKATVAGSIADLPALPAYSPTLPKRRVWPWVAAGVAILFLLGIVIAAVIAIPQIFNRPNPGRVATSDSPAPDTRPQPTVDSDRAPTDEGVALAQLTEVEKEWTVANIEADKDKLEKILAEEYRGGNPVHTKQQYLDELQPDSSVKSWEFQDLRVDLNGDRAKVSGYLRQVTTRGTEVFSFTDDFVWRDGRWQATGSRTTRVK